MSVSASWAKDTRVCSFFVFHYSGEVRCDGGDDEDEREATTDEEDAEQNLLFKRVMVDQAEEDERRGSERAASNGDPAGAEAVGEVAD